MIVASDTATADAAAIWGRHSICGILGAYTLTCDDGRYLWRRGLENVAVAVWTGDEVCLTYRCTVAELAGDALDRTHLAGQRLDDQAGFGVPLRGTVLAHMRPIVPDTPATP